MWRCINKGDLWANMICKRAVVFRCQCKYSLVINGALRVIVKPSYRSQTDHITCSKGCLKYLGAEMFCVASLVWSVNLVALISAVNHHTCNPQTVKCCGILGHKWRPIKKKKTERKNETEKANITLRAASAAWRWKQKRSLCLVWQDHSASRCMFTTCHRWCHLCFDASTSQCYLLRHIWRFLSAGFLQEMKFKLLVLRFWWREWRLPVCKINSPSAMK